MRGISGTCHKSYAPREEGFSQGAFFLLALQFSDPDFHRVKNRFIDATLCINDVLYTHRDEVDYEN